MKKLLISLLLLFSFSLLIGAEWSYLDLYFTDDGSYTATLNTIETDTTTTYNFGNIKTLPSEITFTHKAVPTAKTGGDGIDIYITMYCSNDATLWYSYGAIDTVTIDSTKQADGTTVIDNVTITDVPNYRYFRLMVANQAAIDTCTLKIQKSEIY